MPASKIQNEKEVLRWFAEGRTYAWMSEYYRRIYDIEIGPTAWGNFRQRRGLGRRQAMNDQLIPWQVRAEHRNTYPLGMLRMECRRLDGLEMRDVALKRLQAWKEKLRVEGLVVHYDPDTPEGFSYLPRCPHDEDSLIRRPATSTRVRRPVGP
ncbi:hypothetical protein O2V63_11955 [Modestobacter sp. VKM Ac-2977]|uniref:hypothetical protein n=1 Tax=Modestobacter sp. VKM Ac-2977 TaxID=3004131 RepID=UPI0022AA6CF0|nr:hypothetical protein [Modestobacter sp. VKM Ac-2977]MCZ2821046.1 hypothetical protein [Modestobacter sp. VKM Ac-2977]